MIYAIFKQVVIPQSPAEIEITGVEVLSETSIGKWLSHSGMKLSPIRSRELRIEDV